MDMVTVYWTGWWPVSHVLVDWNPFGDVILTLHVTIDLLLDVDVALDGLVSLFEPFLTSQGFTSAAAIQETEAAVYRLKSFHAVMNPWEWSDIASIFTAFAGLFAGTNAVATAVWMAALGVWWLSLANAIWNEYQGMVDGVLERYDVGLQCIQKGFQYVGTGATGLYAGIQMNQNYNEKVLSNIAESVIDDNPAKEIIDDTVVGNVIAGGLQMITGFAVVIIGVLIWGGL